MEWRKLELKTRLQLITRNYPGLAALVFRTTLKDVILDPNIISKDSLDLDEDKKLSNVELYMNWAKKTGWKHEDSFSFFVHGYWLPYLE